MPDKILNADGSIVPIVALLGSGAAGGVATSANATPTVNASLTPKGYQQIAAATLAASTALTPPVGSRIAQINVEAQAVRWRDDGVAPTATVGMLIPVGTTFEYDGDLTAVRFIAATAGTILNVSFYA